MSKKPETKFKERVRKDLEKLPFCWFVKVQQVALRGIPDFLICLNGAFVAIELKKDEKQEPDKLQKWTIDSISHAGGATFIVHPGNWYETYSALEHLSGMDKEVEYDSFH